MEISGVESTGFRINTDCSHFAAVPYCAGTSKGSGFRINRVGKDRV